MKYCLPRLQEGYDQGPGLGSDEPEADGGYERVHGDGGGLLSRVIQCCLGCDVTSERKNLQLLSN